MFTFPSRLRIAALLVLCMPGPIAAQGPANSTSYALLVGCTTYRDPAIPTLVGPANDVRAWAALLTDRDGFAFPAANVTQLVGWNERVSATRPTRENIAQAVAALATKAKPGDRVFILLSGHGAQVPIPKDQDPLDPKNPEPDGLDEIFLPADVRTTKDGPENAIRDDEVGVWLDRIRAKGADVLIVFDCCHAGTMARGDRGSERNRTVRPDVLGISDRAMEDAQQRAAEARKKAAMEGRHPDADEKKPSQTAEPKGGSLVAFYAAQPFEPAPELLLPPGVPDTPENCYGLLSFTLVQALRQRQSSLTSRELAQVVATRYRSTRGVRGPLPFAEGDLDREVLGYKTWPNRGRLVLLQEADQPLRVSAGRLAGMAPNSVLAVRPPAIDAKKRDPKTILGYVRVKSATGHDAEVVPCEFAGKPAVAVANLENLCRCEVVAREYGDMRVKLFLGPSRVLREAFDTLDKDIRDMVLLVGTEAEADWVLKRTCPQCAALEGIKLASDHILLLRGGDRTTVPKEGRARELTATRVFGVYPVGEVGPLAKNLALDLPKVFRWQNVWRVAAEAQTDRASDAGGVRLEVTRFKGEKDVTGGRPLSSGAVSSGEFLEFQLTNRGQYHVWVVALFLDAELGIEEYGVISVEANKSAKLTRAEVTLAASGSGVEGMVLLVFPQEQGQPKPDFRFLNQAPLRVAEVTSRGDQLQQARKTPFGALLARSALSAGPRGATVDTDVAPVVVVQTWFVVP